MNLLTLLQYHDIKYDEFYKKKHFTSSDGDNELSSVSKHQFSSSTILIDAYIVA